MKKYLLYLLIVILIAASGVGGFYYGKTKAPEKIVYRDKPEPACKHDQMTYDDVLLEINEYRLANNLSMFKSMEPFTDYAQLRANDQDLSDNKQLTHVTNRNVYDYLREQNVKPASVAELLTVGANACDAVTRWKTSPTHNAGLLDPNYTVIGIGINDKIVVLELGSL